MFQEGYNRFNPSEGSKKNSGCRQGCFMILIPLAIIYFSHAVYLIVPNTINQVKWRIRGSGHYQYTVSKIGLFPREIQMGRNVVVKDGEIEFISNVSLSGPVYSSDVETIEELLNGVYFCSLLFPLTICSYQYDSSLGYPSAITVNCPIPDACYSHTVLENLEILSP